MSRTNAPNQAIPQWIREKINSLNDLQVRMLVERSLDQQKRISGGVEASDDLRQALAYWSKLERKKISYGEASIDETMDVAREFGMESIARDRSLIGNESLAQEKFLARDRSLASDGEFANYIKGFAVYHPVESATVMKIFCKCLVLANTKTQEQQEEFFMSFPPSGDDLKCLDGTEERLEIIERSLSSNEPFFPFLGASDLVMRNLADDLKYDVKEGNQVHIPKYFESSLSLIADHVPPYPQSQIPFAKSTRAHEDYPGMFKKFLLVDIGRLLRGSFKEINEAISSAVNEAIREHGFRVPASGNLEIADNDYELLEIFASRLKKFGGKSLKHKEENGVYALDKVALSEAGCDLPCLRFLDKVRSDVDFVAAGSVSTDEGLIECRRSLLEPENIFAAEGVDNLTTLATIGTPNDKVFALDIVWMLGQKLLSSSNRIFFDTVGLILENNPNFFNEAREELEKFLPGYSQKIDDILQHRQFLEGQDYFSSLDDVNRDDDMSCYFYDLIDYGCDTNTILEKIASFPDIDELNGALEVTDGGAPNHQNAVSCRTLLHRPDLGKILEAIKDKAAGLEVNRKFVEISLRFLENRRNLDDYCAVAKAIGNSSLFTGSSIFHLLAESNRGDLIRDLAPMIQGHPELLRQELKGEFPLDLAARKGGGDFIAEVFKILSPEDRDHFLLSCSGRTLSGLAAKHGQVDSMCALAESGYDVFAQDNSGNNAVHYAAFYGQQKILDTLSEFSSQPWRNVEGINAQNSVGKTPLLFAFEQEKNDLIGWMHKHGADPLIEDDHGVSPISLALDKCDPKPLRELAKAGFDLGRYLSTQDKENGTIGIYRLLKSGRNDAVSTLIQAGLNISAYNKDIKGTLAHYAVEKNELSILPLLKGLGANLSTPDREGITPLIKAFESRSNDAVAILISLLDRDLREEFKIAFDSGNDRSAMILQKLGFDINSKNLEGKTMLHETVAQDKAANGQRSYSDKFLKLVELGADPAIVDSKGFAADYLAIKNGMTKVASSIRTDRFDSIIIDAINKNDVVMLRSLDHYSKYRGKGYATGHLEEDLMWNRRESYVSLATSVGTEVQECINAVVDKRRLEQEKQRQEQEQQRLRQEQQDDELDKELCDIWDGNYRYGDQKTDMPPSPLPSSSSVHDAKTSQVAPPLPPQPAAEISTRVINSERDVAAAATALSGIGKSSANDNSTGKS